MHAEHQFADLTESLRKGFLADQIVLALARVGKEKQVSEDDRAIFSKAVEILKLVEEGHGWLDTLRFGRQTRLGTNYFGQAVEALPEAKTSDTFVKNIESLKKTAQDLASGRTLPATVEIGELRLFFFNAAQIESDRTDELLSGEHDSKLHSWLRNNA